MSSYWKDYYNRNSSKFDDSLVKQVGKTVSGKEVDPAQLICIADRVAQALDLNHLDSIADLCCGNGLITRIVAARVKRVLALDYSEGLISVAREKSQPGNVEYVLADVTQLPARLIVDIEKFYMYEALQHFSIKMLQHLLSTLHAREIRSSIFLGSVPDSAKLDIYYDTEEKIKFYQDCERSNKPHMGKWWSQSELSLAASECGFQAKFFNQNPSLYTSGYRFDCLLEKIDE